ncbi:MAG: GT4 family glycosyltransferase PelF, partial [Giesbergeria sp.]
MNTRKAESADVALVLEGTFPYVSGGVSSWINQMIRAYPEIRFAIVFLGSRREDYKEFKYPLPDNVVHFEEHYLYGNLNTHQQPAMRTGDSEAFDLIDQLIDALQLGADHPQTMEVFRQVALQMQPGGRLRVEDFLYSQRAWDLICEVYRNHCSDPSFVDFFWTVRIMFQPLWLLARVASELIPVRVVHSASTGYAGFLGGLLEQTRGTPLVLSEHGIYTKERKIDLFK